MNNLTRTLTAVCFLLGSLFLPSRMQAQSSIWATAYYAGWQQGYNNTGYMPAQNVDYSAVTHIIHFALVPNSDGTLNDASNSVTAYNANELITRAHAAGKKVLICVGGWNTGGSFSSATSSANVSTFVNNLVSLMKNRGYDGIDIDWEPISSSDASQFAAFITQLRSSLDGISPRPLLTTANGGSPSVIAPVKDKFDQINIMSYDMAGSWPGWVTWHNSPLYDGGFRFPSTGNLVPSSDGLVKDALAAGIPASKLGIGIDFYGYVWNGGDGTSTGGATQPRQTWTSAPSVQSNVPYYTIMKSYYQSQYYKFDNAAGVSYLSIDNAGSVNDKFISYDDEATIAAKINYVKSQNIGGAIIWELGGGYRSDMPTGQKDLLLQAVKQALGGSTPADATPPTISLTAPANGATIGGTISVSANATDNVSVAGVQFKLDGANIGSEATSSPYSVSLNTSLSVNGSHTITATARDAAGNMTSASVSVSILNSILDGTAPTVTLTSPANGSSVSGTVTLSANASDNIAVTSVTFSVDGTTVGSDLLLAPYTASWNSTLVGNGSHTIAATARDAAGNQSTSSATVTVSNSTGGSSSDLLVYGDALQSPWLNNSWSAAVTFGNTEQAVSGSSIKTVLTAAWGALSLHYGNWGTTGVTTGSYTSLDFAVYPTTSTTLYVLFENDGGQTFPSVSTGSLPANQWTVVSIPMSKLNPNNLAVSRLDLQDVSGSAKTYYVDNLKFSGSALVAQAPAAPTLGTPANGASNASVNSTLTWNASTGASSYRLQVAGNSAFTSPVVDRSGLTSASSAVSGLANSTAYYWRVNASNSSGTSAWSATSGFTTVSATDTVKPAVSFTSPAAGSTVSGTVTINANASDNIAVKGVQFNLDGNSLGAELTASPYTCSWNTSGTSNGTHTLSATARDSAGNTATASLTVTVSNGTTASSDLWVYQDAMPSAWINASWSATVDFASAERAYAGSASIKVVQAAWGALRMHSGQWGSPISVNPRAYSAVEFYVNGGPSGISMGVFFENDQNASFPAVKYVWVAADTWQKVSLPMSQLDPNNFPVDRIVIQDLTGRTKTFYVDNIRFVGSGVPLADRQTADAAEVGLPQAFDLGQNFPNPFNPSTMISYALPQDAHVTIEIFNTIGQRVALLSDDLQVAGTHEVRFDASQFASGVYFYRLTARPLDARQSVFVQTKKMLFQK